MHHPFETLKRGGGKSVTVGLIEPTKDWARRQGLQSYLLARPLGRFWINFWRRREGLGPLRSREVRTELAELRRRRDARLAQRQVPQPS